MSLISDLAKNHDQMCRWRQHIHRFPETAYEEYQTSDYIADLLRSFGLDVHQGLAETAVVASLSCGNSRKKIALRADMDALFIQEQNNVPYRSRHDGKMHACGHDGHSAMLLGAARHLAENANFNGTVHFIFQPAEEGRAGAKRMIEEGLFKKFPVENVFGMHNFPDIPQGHFAVKAGPMMAAFDCFEITITGQASHAAMPHLCRDPIVAAAQLIQALQSVISRNVNPDDSAVLSLTQIHAGETWNAIPESVVLRGTFRCFKPEVQQLITQRIRCITDAVCASFEMTGSIRFNPENAGYPVTFNDAQQTALAIKAATEVVGADRIHLDPAPSMGSEDFAFMLQEKPGCYIWIGNGPSQGNCLLHNPNYDFNDEILPVGAAYWVQLVQKLLD